MHGLRIGGLGGRGGGREYEEEITGIGGLLGNDAESWHSRNAQDSKMVTTLRTLNNRGPGTGHLLCKQAPANGWAGTPTQLQLSTYILSCLQNMLE